MKSFLIKSISALQAVLVLSITTIALVAIVGCFFVFTVIAMPIFLIVALLFFVEELLTPVKKDPYEYVITVKE